MEVAVLIAGVADPKWPLPAQVTPEALRAHGERYAVPSPFDESALELALKLRDADPAVRVTALVAAGEPLARKVAGWRPDALHRLDLEAVPRWDGGATGAALAGALRGLAPESALVLVGREFGDLDDGTVPAALAHGAGLAQVGLALALERRAEGLWALRQAAGGLERVRLPAPALLAVSNDPGNRLRHPLMKNVMAAKTARIGLWRAEAADPCAALEGVKPASEPPRRAACEWIEGSAAEKARALARVLMEAGRA